MKNDDVTAILTKTRDYLAFIKNRLEQGTVLLRSDDSDTLKNIETYLKIVGEDMFKWSRVKSEVHKNIVGSCLIYLERLDRIAKDYKIFQNGHSH